MTVCDRVCKGRVTVCVRVRDSVCVRVMVGVRAFSPSPRDGANRGQAKDECDRKDKRKP